MAIPAKLYPDYVTSGTGANGSTTGFKFITRDPAKEMEYTVATLKELMAVGGDWDDAETAAGTVLKTRFKAVENFLYDDVDAKWAAKLTTLKNEVSGTQPEFAYVQYLAGMSAAFGGGHTATSIFGRVNSEERKLAIIDATLKTMQGMKGITYQSTSAMPLIVPMESQLVADAAASAVEAFAMGEIRAQQVRQSKAAGNILKGTVPNAGTNPTPYEEVLAFASVQATGEAAFKE